MTRRRAVLAAVGALAGILVLAGVAGILVLRSAWFREKLREQVVAAVETATGGRAEIGSLEFDWKTLRLDLRPFVLHGTEPAGKPPLLRATSVTAGLTVVSLFRRDVDIRSLDVQDPRIYLIVDPGGRTNVPEPKTKPHAERTPFETLVDLAIGRFALRSGVFEVEGRSRTPFDLQGRNLAANFGFEFANSLYRGDLSVQPLDVKWGAQAAVPLGVRMALTLGRNRLGVASARLTTGDSLVDFAGSVEDLSTPRASFTYQASLAAADVRRLAHIEGIERGTAEVDGTFAWAGASTYSLAGYLRASGVEFRQPRWQVRNGAADGALRADARGASLNGVRFAGDAVQASRSIPVRGRAGELTLRGPDLDASRLSLEALGGSFAGDVRIRAFDRFQVRGSVSDLEARRAVAVYSPTPLPWDSVVSGTVSLDGSVRRPQELRASATLTLAPARQGPPVRGQVAATYDARAEILDLGHSFVLLPSSRIDLTGAIGRRLQVRLTTRDVDDFLPVLGEAASAIPVKLQNGALTFDGAVTGPLEDPRIDGRLDLARFSYAGEPVDSLSAAVSVSPEQARLQNAAVTRGAGRLQFELAVGLHGWRAKPDSTLAGSGTIRNASVAELLALAGQTDGLATGTIASTGQISGTLAAPQFRGSVEVVKGVFRGEPYDLFTATLTETGRDLQVASGEWIAGSKQVRLAGSFDHPLNRYDSGRLRFQIQTNTLPLDEIRTLNRMRPGIQGTVQATAAGTIDVLGPAVPERFRISELQADVTGGGLQLTGQSLGDAHLTAQSEGRMLRTHLESSFANSVIRGDGEWRLEGDYPGTATIAFSRVDLAALRDWIAPSPSGSPYRFAGTAQGEVRLNGPALKPELIQAELRIPSLEIQPAPDATPFALRNSGPIVARMANGVFTVESARLTGPSTDLTIAGRVSLPQRNPLDLRLSGRIDLAILDTVSPGLKSSGAATVEASVRGPFNAPQLTGRLDLAGAAFNYADLPNGITNASGSILFAGDQATIQNLTGESGGGKIQLSGFAGYASRPAVFRLHLAASQVRVRYPEGVSTVTDLNLNLTGTSERSLLSGTVTIRRATVNLQSDFSSLLARSQGPVSTAPAATGFLAGLNYDVQIQTSPDIQFESALTQGVEASANLQVRGTAASPALLGRINITQGQVNFFGTRYSVSQGSISFLNPVRIEPVLNLDLETRARGIDVTLNVSGPLGKLNLTTRSDPPLQFSDIVMLLTTGQNPYTETARLGQQSSGGDPFQQSVGSALLGQVLTSPVSGRLERFFGISKLRVDPTLPGVEYNPLARLTLEQQVTPNLTFTYITYITSANPQVVSVEWALSKQWSAYALREENGQIGLQFFFKKQFK